MRWAVGLTTVQERKDSLLPATLHSLRMAGFEAPRLFVDGISPAEVVQWQERFALPITARFPRLTVHGNWLLGLHELFIRDPWADRYAMFQDDLLACKGLREYLETAPYPHNGYLNLCSFRENEAVAPQGTGWYRAQMHKRGLGAQALVFSHEAALTLLRSPHMVNRPMNRDDPARAVRLIDGGIVEAMNKAGWHEYCHTPSLVQHVGTRSSIRGGTIPENWTAASFPGEAFDARTIPIPKPHREPLRALTTSVGYGDILALTLPYNRDHFAEYMVATTPEDEETQAVAMANDCRLHVTDAFHFEGAPFAKYRAIEEALDAFGREGCLALVDADICWPKHAPLDLQAGVLYSPYRREWSHPSAPIPPESEWRRFPANHNAKWWAGYTQIFHASDPALGPPPWHLIDGRDASTGDVEFQKKWKYKLRPSWECLHLGPNRVNWKGRVSPRIGSQASGRPVIHR